MEEGINPEKTPIKMIRRRKEEATLKENARMDKAIPPIPMNHS
jgi:hypothetical protein